MITKRKDLEILLEQLDKVSNLKIEYEQYPSPPRVAANLLWIAGFDNNDILNKNILDLGCGAGILAIGAAYLGAKSVIGLDIDYHSLELAKHNSDVFDVGDICHWVCGNAENFRIKNIDVTIMNPPFGMRKESLSRDRDFLKTALAVSNTIYSINPYAEKTREFFIKYCKELGAKILSITQMNFEIKRQYQFHKKAQHVILVDLYHIKKELV